MPSDLVFILHPLRLLFVSLHVWFDFQNPDAKKPRNLLYGQNDPFRDLRRYLKGPWTESRTEVCLSHGVCETGRHP